MRRSNARQVDATNGSSDNRRASRTRYLRLFETIRHASLCPELGRKGRSLASVGIGRQVWASSSTAGRVIMSVSLSQHPAGSPVEPKVRFESAE